MQFTVLSADPAPPPAPIRTAVAIAGLSAVIVGLVTWGIDELKHRFGSRPTAPAQDAGSK